AMQSASEPGPPIPEQSLHREKRLVAAYSAQAHVSDRGPVGPATILVLATNAHSRSTVLPHQASSRMRQENAPVLTHRAMDRAGYAHGRIAGVHGCRGGHRDLCNVW